MTTADKEAGLKRDLVSIPARVFSPFLAAAAFSRDGHLARGFDTIGSYCGWFTGSGNVTGTFIQICSYL